MSVIIYIYIYIFIEIGNGFSPTYMGASLRLQAHTILLQM